MRFDVMIVDDDNIAVFIHTNVIRKSHFHNAPLSFINGKKAFDYILLHDASDQSYCILLDINMPEMNGWEFLDAISQQAIASQLFVVMVTSSVDAADKEKATTYKRVIRYLEKPITITALDELKKHDSLLPFFNPVYD